MLSATSFWAPALTAVTAISEATPMTTPSAVSDGAEPVRAERPERDSPVLEQSPSRRQTHCQRAIDRLVGDDPAVGEPHDPRRPLRDLARSASR